MERRELSRAEAATRFRPRVDQAEQPEIHLRADQGVAYRYIAQTLPSVEGGR